MVEHEGGQWNVATKENEVYLERVSEDSERLFDDSLAPEEARQLARLLTKHADGISESAKSAKADDSDKDSNDKDSNDKDSNDKDSNDKDSNDKDSNDKDSNDKDADDKDADDKDSDI
jgi:hypothetical protein